MAPTSSRPALLSWKVWLVGSIVLAALGGAAFAWAATSYPKARAEEWADASAGLRGEGQRAEVIAGTAFTLAGLVAITSLVLGLTE
ncbi:MAG: hypothetical protein JNK82_10345 [Myxococcaceae bacterium]|nr:hypothetical protein [Myxococcaceae bacterium]